MNGWLTAALQPRSQRRKTEAGMVDLGEGEAFNKRWSAMVMGFAAYILVIRHEGLLSRRKVEKHRNGRVLLWVRCQAWLSV